MVNENIFQIKNIRLTILKFLIKQKCINCMENEILSYKTKYCEWCGYNIYHNIKFWYLLLCKYISMGNTIWCGKGNA